MKIFINWQSKKVLSSTWLSDEVIGIYKNFNYTHLHYFRVPREKQLKQKLKEIINIIIKNLSSKIEENIILLDSSSEGYRATNLDFIKSINEIMKVTKVSSKQIVIINQNVIFSQNDSTNCSWAFGDIFSIQSKEILKKIENEVPLKTENKKKFICLNYKIRPNRLLIYSFLYKTGLLDSTHFSFSLNPVGGTNFWGENFSLVLEKTKTLFPSFSDDLMKLSTKASLESKVDDIHNISQVKEIIWNMPIGAFLESSLVIVTETSFHLGNTMLRFTEKSLKPLLLCKPFIIIGEPNTLNLLKTLGFKTFSPLINEKYDKINNPTERFKAICNEIIKVSEKLDLNSTYLDDLDNICKFNKDHILSGDFYNNVMNLHKKTLMDSLSK